MTATVNAKTQSEKATMSGTGETKLEDDENDITITVTSEAGEAKKYVVTINKVDDPTTVSMVLEKSNLNIKDNYIVGIRPETKASVIKSSIITSGARNVTIKNSKGIEIKDTDILGTDYKVTISTLLESKTFTLVVKGDTSGDGKVTILDLLQVRKHINGDNKLNNTRFLAGDTSGDNKITILDLLQVRKHINGDKKL